MKIFESMKIPDETFEKWDDIFLPQFELIYLDDDDMESLPEDILIMPINEFKANPSLNSVDVNTTFTPWNIKSGVNYVAVIENEQFDRLQEDLQERLLQKQYDLGRGNIYKWSDFEKFNDELVSRERQLCTEHLQKMSFNVNGEPYIGLRKNHWSMLPWAFRKNVLESIAENYSGEAMSNNMDVNKIQLSPFIQSYINRFPDESGANCFATALSGITENPLSANWIIHQWVHPDTFLISLRQRQYEKIDELTEWKKVNLQEKDIIVWVNKDMTPIHATASIDSTHVFNKDGQTMFNPWLVRDFKELASYWDDVITEGGKIHHYRKK